MPGTFVSMRHSFRARAVYQHCNQLRSSLPFSSSVLNSILKQALVQVELQNMKLDNKALRSRGKAAPSTLSPSGWRKQTEVQ